MGTFRCKRTIPLPYHRQGYIYFASRSYKRLPEAQQATIRKLCREAGAGYEEALLEFVTTDTPATEICRRHYIGSHTTLYKMVRRYYMSFPSAL